MMSNLRSVWSSFSLLFLSDVLFTITYCLCLVLHLSRQYFNLTVTRALSSVGNNKIERTRRRNSSVKNKMNSKSDVSVEKGETESEKFSNKNNEKFPKSAIFILVNVLFDRFSSGGIMGE